MSIRSDNRTTRSKQEGMKTEMYRTAMSMLSDLLQLGEGERESVGEEDEKQQREGDSRAKAPNKAGALLWLQGEKTDGTWWTGQDTEERRALQPLRPLQHKFPTREGPRSPDPGRKPKAPVLGPGWSLGGSVAYSTLLVVVVCLVLVLVRYHGSSAASALLLAARLCSHTRLRRICRQGHAAHNYPEPFSHMYPIDECEVCARCANQGDKCLLYAQRVQRKTQNTV
jgi:hypothetical protein